MEKIKLSVIVPVRNVENFLHLCLDSIINQTLKEIEIICVENDSTDNSLQILNQYAKKDKRIIVISQEGGGLSAARNTGIELSQGDYIVFIDSDDFISENYLSVFYKYCSEHNLDYAFTKSQTPIKSPFENEEYKILYKKKNIPKKIIYQTLEEKIENQLGGYEFSALNKCFKRSYLLENKYFFIRNLYYEDSPFCMINLFFAKTTLQIPVTENIYYFYLKRKKSLMKTDTIHPTDIFKALEKTLENYRERFDSLTHYEKMLFYLTFCTILQPLIRSYLRTHRKTFYKPSILKELFQFIKKSKQIYNFIDSYRKELVNTPSSEILHYLEADFHKNNRAFLRLLLTTFLFSFRYKRSDELIMESKIPLMSFTELFHLKNLGELYDETIL